MLAHHGARHGWMAGMLWRIWEKHGSCGNPQMCSAWWLVVLFMVARSSTWWLSSLLAQPGEAAQLMARWGPLERGGSVDSVLNMGGQWRIMGPAGRLLSSTWLVVSSTWWIGGGSSKIKWVEGMECSSEWMVGSAAKKQQWMDEQQKTIDGPAKMRMYPAMVAGTRFVLPTRGKF
uniref:Uncharacterized protein n=1 Tax=Meloidogyne incognita TaxID=6306 RepID=A0A914N5C6_MELIC